MKMENIDEVVTAVATWNANAGNTPSDDVNERDHQLLEQLKLVKEELEELKSAIADSDDVEIIDAICDINVVAAYAAILMNTPFTYDIPDFEYDVEDVGVDTVFLARHATSSTFTDDVLSEVIVGGTIYLLDKLISEESLQYRSQLYETLYGIGQYLYMVGVRCYGYEVMAESMTAVLQTNDAKFLTKESAEGKLEETIKAYEGRYDGIVVCETPLGKACFRCDNGNGKILKPYDWVAPDIKSILAVD